MNRRRDAPSGRIEVERVDKLEFDILPGLKRLMRIGEGHKHLPPVFQVNVILIAEVLHAVDGVPDADNWTGIFRLKDGRFGYLSAGCDYTGWDCSCEGDSEVADTLPKIEQYLTDEDKSRLQWSTPRRRR